MKVIIYGSEYGNAMRYAKELSNRTHIKTMNYQTVRDLSMYDTIIYIGGIYASEVKGLKQTMHLLKQEQQVKLIVVTVGLFDPNQKEYTDKLKSAIDLQLPKERKNHVSMFHLRGGIDYANLRFSHKVMMKFLYKAISKKAIEEQSSEDKEFIASYNKKLDYVDVSKLDEIVECIYE